MDTKELQGKKVSELKELAKSLEIEGYYTMKKDELIDAIFEETKPVEMPKLKASKIGAIVYVPALKTNTVVTVEKTEMFRKLGMNQLFENDITHPKGSRQPRSTDVKRVGGQ